MLCIDSSVMSPREMVVTDCGTSRSGVGVLVAAAVCAGAYAERRGATTRTASRVGAGVESAALAERFVVSGPAAGDWARTGVAANVATPTAVRRGEVRARINGGAVKSRLVWSGLGQNLDSLRAYRKTPTRS